MPMCECDYFCQVYLTGIVSDYRLGVHTKCMYNLCVEFEQDEHKNSINIDKHGFDFSDAWAVFDAPMLVKHDTREEYGEDRFIGIGILRKTIVVIVFTENIEKDTIRVFP